MIGRPELGADPRFEGAAGRYPDDVRAAYLACDAEAMRAAFDAAMAEGALSADLGAWRTPCP